MIRMSRIRTALSVGLAASMLAAMPAHAWEDSLERQELRKQEDFDRYLESKGLKGNREESPRSSGPELGTVIIGAVVACYFFDCLGSRSKATARPPSGPR